jgi:hypothetical protein
MGSRTPLNCPPGTYRDAPGAKSKYDCKACEPGQYCLGAGLPRPDGDCLPGYYCPLGSRSRYQYTTLPGFFSLAKQAAPSPCLVGEYQPMTA